MVHQQQRTGKLIKNDACPKLQIDFGDEVYYLPKTVKFNRTLLTVPTDLGNVTVGVLDQSERIIAQEFNVSKPPDLHFSYFSGKYEADFTNRAGVGGVRPVYYEDSTLDHADPSLGMFYYCEEDERWVFTIRAFLDAGAVPAETKVNCEHRWLMRSPITQSTVLDEVPTSGWRIWTGILDDASDFSIKCVESCRNDINCGVNRGECHGGACKCYNGFIGDFCNRDKACDWLWAFDDEGLNYGLTYQRLDGFTAHGRPVYQAPSPDNFGDGTARYEVILYTGRRWYDIYLDENEFVANLASDLHAYWNNLLLENTVWFTEPNPSFVPTGPIKWFEISASQEAGNYGPFGHKIEAAQRFECSAVDCNSPSRICGAKGVCEPAEPIIDYDGTIVEGGVCNCTTGFHSHFCDFEIVDSTNATPAA